jgi:ribosomal protein S18 acetylase RimI-like enzyme
MNTRYTLLDPTTQDTKSIIDLIRLSWFEIYPNEAHGISKKYIKDLTDRLLGKSGEDDLARRITDSPNDAYSLKKIAKDADSNIVGYITGQLNVDEYELQNFFIKKEHQGTGLSMLLWNSFLEWTDSSKVIWLEMTPYTERAPAFYKKIGFEILSGSESFSGNTKIPMITMVRKSQFL